MAHIILFGGGDGGGIIITAHGVRRIPPFDPALLAQLRGVSLLVNSIDNDGDKVSQGELRSITTKAANYIVEQIEGIFGPLDKNSSIVFDDPEGGFTCGSTGKPPIPIPQPHFLPPVAADMFANGQLNDDILSFGRAVREKGVDLADAFENPKALAKRLNVPISAETAAALKSVAPSQLGQVADPVDREVLEYFHKVMADGRFVRNWALRPAEIGRAIGVVLSPEALDRVIVAGGGGNPIGDPSGPVSNPAIVIGVVVAVVIMLVPTEAGRARLSVRDLSQVAKF